MRLITQKVIERDACFLAILLDNDGRNLSHVAHFRRAVKACIVLCLAELKNRLNVLRLSDNQIIALEVERGFHIHSSGITFTTPAAVS